MSSSPLHAATPRKRSTLDDLIEHARLHADDPAAWRAIALAYGQRRQFDHAAHYVQKAVAVAPSVAQYRCDLARAFSWLGKAEEEASALREALRIDPGSLDACLRLALRAEADGEIAEARRLHLLAAHGAPGELEAYAGVCRTLIREGERDVLGVASRALSAGPGDIRLLKGLALALQAHGYYDRALSHWDEALRHDPLDCDALIEAANSEVALRNLDRAGVLYERASAAQPGNRSAALSLIYFKFRTGRLDQSRERMRAALNARVFSQHWLASQPDACPVWTGIEDLSGATVLLECPGAFGDNIQFARFAMLFHERGARVILQALPALHEVLETIPGVHKVVAPYDPCENPDFQCRADIAMFLTDWDWGWISRTTPYLSARPCHAPELEQVQPGALKIGLVWRSQATSMTREVPAHKQASNPYAFRSTPLAALQPVSEVPNAVLLGLQVGPGVQEITPHTRAWMPQNLTYDFAATAGILNGLDAVVTVDSAMAHLTGACGKPCFLLLPYCPEFRWATDSATFLDGGRCSWYRSTRVFRQPRPGDWASVIGEVAAEIKKLVPASCVA